VQHHVVDQAIGGKRAGPALRRSAERLDQRPDAAREHGLVEGLLALEVIVEAGGVELAARGDVANGGAGEAVLGE